jgi:hypothetical protein
MDARIPKIVVAALLLAGGCARTPAPPAGKSSATAPPQVQPRPAGWDRPVFAPEPPHGTAPAARSGVAPFTLVRADGTPIEEDLPDIPRPAGWVPAAKPSSRDVLGLDFDRPEFGEDDVIVIDLPPAPPEAGGDEAGCEEESVAVETVVYYEAVDAGTEIVEVGYPVLVVEGWRSWGCGPFPAVRSARCFDPCVTPPRGACWEPLPYDPCWNPCGDPEWRSWNSFANACEDRDLQPRRRHVGLATGGDGEPTRVYDPRSNPGTIFHPAPADPALLPPAGGPGREALHGPSGDAAWAPAAEDAGLASPSPGSRDVLIGRIHGAAGGTDASSGQEPRPHRLFPGVRRPAAAEPEATATTAAASPAETGRDDGRGPVARHRPERTDRRPQGRAAQGQPDNPLGTPVAGGGDSMAADDPTPDVAPARTHEAPRARARDRDDDAPAAREERPAPRHREEPARSEPDHAPAAREQARGRDRDDDGRAEDRRAEGRRADPSPAPHVEAPAARGGGGRDRDPGPVSPPPAPDPPRHGGDGRHK